MSWCRIFDIREQVRDIVHNPYLCKVRVGSAIKLIGLSDEAVECRSLNSNGPF